MCYNQIDSREDSDILTTVSLFQEFGFRYMIVRYMVERDKYM